MILRIIIGILIGGAIGAVMGHFGRCSSGACPLTANPFRGAIYGGLLGAFLAFSSGPASRTTSNHKEQLDPAKGLVYIETTEAFDQTIIQAKQPCLVDFYSDHCPPCLRLGPTIETLAEEYKGRAVVCKVNTDSARRLASAYRIQAIPAVLFFKDGKVVERLVGLQPKVAYEKILDNLIHPEAGEK